MMLQEARITVRHDPWIGGSGVASAPSIPNDFQGVGCLMPLLTPSDVAATWIDDTWRKLRFDPATSDRVAVLPAWCDGELGAVPGFLRALSFANLRGSDRNGEMRRLIATIRRTWSDELIAVPPLEVLNSNADAPWAAILDPVAVVLGSSLAALIDRDDAHRFLDELVPMLRDGLYWELGVKFPPVQLFEDETLPPWAFRVLINGVPDVQLEVQADSVMVNVDIGALAAMGIEGRAVVNPANANPSAWIPAALAADARRHGLNTWDEQQFVVLTLATTLRGRAADFLGVSEAQVLLQQVASVYPELVAETVPKTVSLFMFTDILRRLVADGIGVRNLHAILTALADQGRAERDPFYLAEYARASLRREITHRMCRGSRQLIVFLVDPEIEQQIGDARRFTETGSYIKLPPEQMQLILLAVRQAFDAIPAGYQMPCLLTVMGVRGPMRRLVAPSMPELQVVSYQDLEPDIDIQPAGRITLNGFRQRFDFASESRASRPQGVTGEGESN